MYTKKNTQSLINPTSLYINIDHILKTKQNLHYVKTYNHKIEKNRTIFTSKSLLIYCFFPNVFKKHCIYIFKTCYSSQLSKAGHYLTVYLELSPPIYLFYQCFYFQAVMNALSLISLLFLLLN
jgi:hypothetical protein